MNLQTKLTEIKGVGAKTAELLAAANLETVGDLINFLPRKFDDFSRVQKIADLTPGKVTIRARAESVSTRFVRRGMRVTSAVFADDSGKVRAVWFNQTYREKQLADKSEFFVSGEFAFNGRAYQLTSPAVELVKDLPTQTARLLPIYPARHGLKPNVTRKILNELKPLIKMLPETLPPEIVKSEKLVSRSDAILKTHFPESEKSAESARQRLAFEELFNLILAAKLNKQENSRLNGFRIPFDQEKIKKFVASLPFTMTAAQKRGLWEILQDFERVKTSAAATTSRADSFVTTKASTTETRDDGIEVVVRESSAADAVKISPMNRLLQGDVGSGKTVVAGAAAFQASLAGFQTAFLAPTEILAAQHAETLAKLLSPFGVNVALLTGSVKGKNRDEILKQIKNGAAQVIVGTHALLQPTVKFHKLGFVVIDEQHRFGVKQRQMLIAKGNQQNQESGIKNQDKDLPHISYFMPHLLAMTATPIPRSLQLTLFGDLDISILNQLPKGRKPILTEIISPNSRAQMNAKILTELENGRQIYFIAPNIEESEKSEMENVENLFKKIKKEFCGVIALAQRSQGDSTAKQSSDKPLDRHANKLARDDNHRNINVAILHGKMKSEQKEKIMREFANGKIQILCATTVVEVGVDVPNATVIAIENADRFGLAQLHQLRGRVGRGEYQSQCFLIQSDNSAPTRRLREIARSNDGFYLSEIDLEIRGAGEIYGTAQHGQLNLQIANLSDTKLIKRAANAAETFAQEISRNPEILLKYKELAQDVAKYQRLTTLN